MSQYKRLSGLHKQLTIIGPVLALAACFAVPGVVSADTLSSGSTASNDNETSTSIDVQNGTTSIDDHPGDIDGGSIDTTGPGSDSDISNKFDTETSIQNKNDIRINNENDQKAETGRCKVKNNTFAGDAACGAIKEEEKPVEEEEEEEHVPPVAEVPPPVAVVQPPAAVLGAQTPPAAGRGAGQVRILAVTGANTAPSILTGLTILGTLAALHFLRPPRKREYA